MKKKEKKVRENPELCDNCSFPAPDVKKRGEHKLCNACAYPAMPGIHCVGAVSGQSIPAEIMRHTSYCTNLILAELRKMHGVL